MPETSKLEKLNRELEKSEKKLRKAINDEKALQHQLKQLTKLVMPQVHRALVTNHCQQCLTQQVIWLNKCLYLKN